MSTMIVIHLSETLDANLRRGRKEAGESRGAARDFRSLLTSHGLHPRPLFPDTGARPLERIWHAACPDLKAGEVVEKLLHTPRVEGAYIKPSEGLPGPP